MKKQNDIKIFEDKQVRSLWDVEQEKWYISIIDVIAVLSDQNTYQGARNYWKVLKHRLLKEGNETVTNCNQLKMEAPDGKMRLTDVADTERLIVNPKDSNVYNRSLACSYTTPSGSHLFPPFYFYKHAIPSGSVKGNTNLKDSNVYSNRIE